MKWDKLKENFSNFQVGKISRDFLINIIKEYQFTNGIEVSKKPVLNCRGKEWKK
ncbi:MAG: hypothetical protein ACOC22_04080 [bacterium]